MNERDYSHRSLYDKLGVTAQAGVALAGRHDAWFARELNARLAKPASTWLRLVYDLIFLRVDEPRDLQRLVAAKAHLHRDGAIWIVHPKGRTASPTDAEVRRVALASGLVDNKISAYGPTHTATRYVIPLLQRK